MIRTILVSALLAGTATTTMAADLVEPVPAAPEAVVEETQVYSWDGAYLGIFGGANWLRSDLDDGTLNRHGTSTGGTIGKFVGWNKQLDNNIVFGLEGDLKYEWNEKKYSGIETSTDWGGSSSGSFVAQPSRSLMRSQSFSDFLSFTRVHMPCSL